MRFRTLFSQPRPVISAEFYPPKTEIRFQNLCDRLSTFHSAPDFVSVTYGAGGTTQSQTLELISQVQQRVNTTAVPHFTCIGASPERVVEFLDNALALGVENIIALRGDLPSDNVIDPNNRFRYAVDLVRFIRCHYTDQFDIAVAGYPEVHPEAPCLQQDIEFLYQKVQAGGQVIITQLFYDNAQFLRWREQLGKADIRVPIVPGIMPIIKLSQAQRITSMCGGKIPAAFQNQLAAYADGSPEQKRIGIDFAIQQSRQLLQEGVPGLHLYGLNSVDTLNQLMNGIGDLVK